MRTSGSSRPLFKGLVVALELVCGCAEPAVSADADEAAEPSGTGPTIERPAWGGALATHRDLVAVDAELRRDANDAALTTSRAGEWGPTAERSTLSMARIGGPYVRAELTDAMASQTPDDRVAALAVASALQDAGVGDSEWVRLEDALWTRYAVTEDPQAASALLLAVARVGGARSIPRFAVELAPDVSNGDGPVPLARRVDALRALGILCSRGVPVDEMARDALAQSLEATRPEEVSAAAYALGRCARVSAESLAETDERKVIVGRMVRAMGSPEYDRLAWIALRALGELPESLPEAVLGETPPPWGTEVEAVRAFAQTAAGREAIVTRLSARLETGATTFEGARSHVLRVALESLRAHARRGPGPTGTDRLAVISAALDAAHAESSGTTRRELALARCEARTLEAIATGELGRIAACADADAFVDNTGPYEVEALLHMSDAAMERGARVDALIARASGPAASVAAPALAALAEISDARVVEVLQTALASEDAGIVAAAAGALASRSVDAGNRELDVVPALRRVVSERSNGDAIEARLMAIEALGVLARAPERGINPESKTTPKQPEAPWLESVVLPLARDPAVAIRRAARTALGSRTELVERFDDTAPVAGRDAFDDGMEDRLRAWEDRPAAGVRVTTTAGAFVIDLRGFDTPLNHANFVGLVREGYYEGIKIHRVAPGFVIQGGDPRGDGYGGPGYLVPCEWSNHRYQRGSVGIALAGKDTGGSQWFVTQTPQPHLDGRYTQIGVVVEGMDVVDRVLPGDAIVSIEALKTL